MVKTTYSKDHLGPCWADTITFSDSIPKRKEEKK